MPTAAQWDQTEEWPQFKALLMAACGKTATSWGRPYAAGLASLFEAGLADIHPAGEARTLLMAFTSLEEKSDLPTHWEVLDRDMNNFLPLATATVKLYKAI